MFNREFIDKFFDITGVDLEGYLLRFAIFIEENYSKIYRYYNGDQQSIDDESFSRLQSLIKEVKIVKTSFENNKSSLNNFGFWELIDFVEQTNTQLLTIQKLPKYLRTVRNENRYGGTTYQYTTKGKETLEQVAANELQAPSPQNDWAQIALQNNLAESDYRAGDFISLTLSRSSFDRFFLESVIAELQNEELYGRDIKSKLTFQEDDLLALQPPNTFIEAVTILSGIVKGDIPEFPQLGIDPGLVGGNVNSLLYSSLVRQFKELFNTDDTIIRAALRNINRTEDYVEVEFEFQSFYGFTFKTNTPLTGAI